MRLLLIIYGYHKYKRCEYLIEVSDNGLATKNRRVRKSMLDLYVRADLFHRNRNDDLPEEDERDAVGLLVMIRIDLDSLQA